MSRTAYLTVQQLVEINKTVLREIKVKKADSHKILNRAALEEIVKKIKTQGSDTHEKAVILLIELTRRHPFASGVRRTAYAAARLFLEANGQVVHVKYDPNVMQGVREGFYAKEEVMNWLKGNEIREFKRA